MRSKFGALGAVSSGLVLITGLLGPQAVTATDPSVSMPDPPAIDVVVDDAEESELSEIAMAEGALGLYFDDDSKQFVVVVPSDDARFTFARVAHLGLRVRVEVSDVSRAEFEEARGRLRTMPADAFAEDDSFGFYFDARLGKLVIESTAPLDVFADIDRDFPSLIELRQEDDGGRESRWADWQPFWGGAAVDENPSTGECSTGFAVKASTTRFMLTAGHCFPSNASVYSPGSGNLMGTIVARATFPVRDMEMIGGKTYEGVIYVSDFNAGLVNGSGNPAVSNTIFYCRSGWATGKVCNLRVEQLDAELCDPECTVNLIRYTSQFGVTSQRGDSGAPFYREISGYVHARGMHVGRIGDNHYAHKWSTISSIFGVSIVKFDD